MRRTYRFPALEILRSFSLPPLEWGFGGAGRNAIRPRDGPHAQPGGTVACRPEGADIQRRGSVVPKARRRRGSIVPKARRRHDGAGGHRPDPGDGGEAPSKRKPFPMHSDAVCHDLDPGPKFPQLASQRIQGGLCRFGCVLRRSKEPIDVVDALGHGDADL
ncbi:MAG: hypothetical protein AAGA32_21610 [Pseudomonadota bacterium]